jgi:NTP pyrophosphatase (non-canonical NTP hydrolase)
MANPIKTPLHPKRPLPVGTRVRYHGSHSSYHGIYTVRRVAVADDLRAVGRNPERDYFIDHCGYELWPEGVEETYRNGDQSLHFVRRGSITEAPVPREITGAEMASHQARVYDLNKAKGWYDEKVPFIQAMGLLVTEIVEAYDAYRESGTAHDFKSELADVYIRLLDDCSRFGIDLPTAVDIYRFPVRPTTGEIDTDLWFLIKPVVKAIEEYRVYGLDYEDKAGPQIAKALAEIYHNLEAICRNYGVELAKAFDLKMTVNWTRPYRHGNKKA